MITLIRQLRISKGFTQATLAHLMDTTTHTIIQWERGRRNPTKENLARLAKIFDVTPEIVACRFEITRDKEAMNTLAERFANGYAKMVIDETDLRTSAIAYVVFSEPYPRTIKRPIKPFVFKVAMLIIALLIFGLINLSTVEFVQYHQSPFTHVLARLETCSDDMCILVSLKDNTPYEVSKDMITESSEYYVIYVTESGKIVQIKTL